MYPVGVRSFCLPFKEKYQVYVGVIIIAEWLHTCYFSFFYLSLCPLLFIFVKRCQVLRRWQVFLVVNFFYLHVYHFVDINEMIILMWNCFSAFSLAVAFMLRNW